MYIILIDDRDTDKFLLRYSQTKHMIQFTTDRALAKRFATEANAWDWLDKHVGRGYGLELDQCTVIRL